MATIVNHITIDWTSFKKTYAYKACRTALVVALIAFVNNLYGDITTGTIQLGVYQTLVLSGFGVLIELLNSLKDSLKG